MEKLEKKIIQSNHNHTECNYCHSKDVRSLFTVEGIGIFKCNSCNIEFSEYSFEKSQELYKEEYYVADESNDSGYGDYASEEKTHECTFNKRLERVEQLMPNKGVMIDYGCAIGHLCKVAKNRGWTIFGSDFSSFGAITTKENYEVETFISDVTYPPIRENSVDLVCMYDLIEHVPNPQEAIRKVSEIIKPNGHIHLVTPDCGSLSRKLFKDSWFHYKPKEHLYYFDQETMRKMLTENGFEIEWIGSSTSHMTFGDIVKRFERYFGETIIGFLIKFLSLVGLAELIVPLKIGNLEAIARPRKEGLSLMNDESVSSLNQILCCSKCKGDLDDSLVCKNCGSTYHLDSNVPAMTFEKPSELKESA